MVSLLDLLKDLLLAFLELKEGRVCPLGDFLELLLLFFLLDFGLVLLVDGSVLGDPHLLEVRVDGFLECVVLEASVLVVHL